MEAEIQRDVLKEGDCKSRFFHLSTIIRRRRNSIDAIKFEAGEWILNKKEIREYLSDKFEELFKQERLEFPADLENLIDPIVSEEDNAALALMSDPQEILPALFFKEYQKIVRNSVIQAVQSLFTSGKMIKEVNSTLIAFIPKTQNPSSLYS